MLCAHGCTASPPFLLFDSDADRPNNRLLSLLVLEISLIGLRSLKQEIVKLSRLLDAICVRYMHILCTGNGILMLE